MPVINNTAVASGTGLSTAGNGGRKLVRLANGTLVSAVRTSTTSWQLQKSTDNGATWSQIVTVTETVNDLALASKGNDIHVLVSFSTTGAKHYRYTDSGVLQGTSVNVDSGQTAIGNVSLAINEAGTELHAAWSSKNSTYQNSFNIRYAKGTINGDGSVTWGAVEQVTKMSNGIFEARSPTIVLDKNGIPVIIYEAFGHRYNNGGSNTTSTGSAHNSIAVIKRDDSLPSKDTVFVNNPTWSAQNVHTGNSHQQASPSAIFVSAAINGLTNGRLWVGWHGKDATDTAKFNIRTAFSDDGGVTWSTPVKQTSGNLYDQTNPSLTADKASKVLLVWDAQNATTTQTGQKVFNGSWGATTTLTGDGYTNVSALFDNSFTLLMTSPPLVRQSSSGVFFNGNFNVGASVSPASGALGNKETTALTAYTVTPEAGSTVTQIVERINGTVVNTFNNPASLSRTLTAPQATWDALAYFATHTASITVTDSNGAQTVSTYTFDKRLANGASLLEATKANNDARNRISTKRDALAAQVGLSAGATFDAISAQLASGAFMKFASGTANSDATNGQRIVVTGLAFKPIFVILYYPNNSYLGVWADPLVTGHFNSSYIRYATLSSTSAQTASGQVGVSGGFDFQVGISSSNIKWFAFGN